MRLLVTALACAISGYAAYYLSVSGLDNQNFALYTLSLVSGTLYVHLIRMIFRAMNVTGKRRKADMGLASLKSPEPPARNVMNEGDADRRRVAPDSSSSTRGSIGLQVFLARTVGITVLAALPVLLGRLGMHALKNDWIANIPAQIATGVSVTLILPFGAASILSSTILDWWDDGPVLAAFITYLVIYVYFVVYF